MSELAFSNVLDCIYEIYKYPASKSIKIFELEHLRNEIVENGYRGNKREALTRIEYLIKELNKEGSN